MPPTLPSMESLCEIFFNETKCIEYLIEQDVIVGTTPCTHCRGCMTLRITKEKYRCTSWACRKERRIRLDTFFATSKLQMHKIMLLGYHWLLKTPSTSVVSAMQCSQNTVTAFTGYFRQLVGESLDIEDTVIGGKVL